MYFRHGAFCRKLAQSIVGAGDDVGDGVVGIGEGRNVGAEIVEVMGLTVGSAVSCFVGSGVGGISVTVGSGVGFMVGSNVEGLSVGAVEFLSSTVGK